MSTKLIIIFGVVFFGAFSAIAAYRHMFMTRITVVNHSAVNFDNVRIDLAGGIVADNSIESGQRIYRAHNPRAEGAVTLKLNACGKSASVNFGYVTRDIGQKIIVTILRPSNQQCIPLSICDDDICDSLSACSNDIIFTSDCGPESIKLALRHTTDAQGNNDER